jgi:hypothetical protein
MKKVVLFALLLVAVAASAHAITLPKTGANNTYRCYYQSYGGPAVDGGRSWWVLSGPTSLLRGTELFDAFHPALGDYIENYKAAFAKPVDFFSPIHGYGTRWEFTFNPSGPQCKNTDIFYNGALILFKSCTDGHSRTCWLQ